MVLEEQVNKMGFTIDEVVKKEHYDIALRKVTMANCITSIKELLRMDCVDAIELVSLNNNNKIMSKMKFKHAIPTTLSNLSLQYGSAEQVTFVVTFEYEIIDLMLENTEDITGSTEHIQ